MTAADKCLSVIYISMQEKTDELYSCLTVRSYHKDAQHTHMHGFSAFCLFLLSLFSVLEVVFCFRSDCWLDGCCCLDRLLRADADRTLRDVSFFSCEVQMKEESSWHQTCLPTAQRKTGVALRCSVSSGLTQSGCMFHQLWVCADHDTVSTCR